MSQHIDIHSTDDAGTNIQNGREDSGMGIGTLSIYRNDAPINSGTQVYYGKDKNGNIEPIAPGGNALPIQNEGIQITPNATLINFTGNANASAVGNQVTVNVPVITPAYTYLESEEASSNNLAAGEKIPFESERENLNITLNLNTDILISVTGVYKFDFVIKCSS